MIGGGIKFLDENAALSNNGGSVSASSGTASEGFAIDKLSNTYWQSVGSNDSVQESLVVTFGSASISRLLLLDHNWKNYTVKYWTGSAWADFSNVVGMNGVTNSKIQETNYSLAGSYYEFTPVTTTQLQILINSTQVANQEKYIATIMPTNELGTVQGYPTVDAVALTRSSRSMTMLSGRDKIVKSNSTVQISLKFEHYPVRDYGADVDLMMALYDRDNPFYIYLCGGRASTPYFSYGARGWRPQDCFRVQTDSNISESFTSNIYTSGLNFDMTFYEHT